MNATKYMYFCTYGQRSLQFQRPTPIIQLYNQGSRRGGGGGDSDTTSSSSSYCGVSFSQYPCNTQLHYIYGSRNVSLFSQTELYVQLVLYALWTIVLIGLFFPALKSKARSLQAAILCYVYSFIFVCVRFGLIVAEADVPYAYRYESSVVTALQRIVAVFLFAGCFPSADVRKLTKLIFYPLLGVLAVLNITYLILDFVVSSKAAKHYEDDWTWRLSDRDFALRMTARGIVELTMNDPRFSLVPSYVEERMFDIASEDGWQKMRGGQIGVGVASEFVTLVLAVLLIAVSALPRILKRKDAVVGPRGTIFLLHAAFGLVLTSLFRVIITTHYVLWNWSIVSDFKRWVFWAYSFQFDDGGIYRGGGSGFLEGYRTTISGFSLIQTLFEPLGVMLACLGMVLWWRGRLNGT